MKTFGQKPLSNMELSELFNQLSILLQSGISVTEALQYLLDDCANEAERDLLTLMVKETELTGLFYPAAEASGVFPSYACHMIRLGEETGKTDEVLAGLSAHYIREENFKGMLRSALIYPAIMLGMMMLVVLLLLTKVMPVFHQVFLQLGQEMKGFSAALLSVGETLSRYSFAFAAGLIIAVIVLLFYRKNLPFFRKINDNISGFRFADGMAIALKSGLTPEQGLSLTAPLIEDPAFLEKISHCKTLLEEGTELSLALSESGIITGSAARMIHIAGKAGRMEDALAQISAEYEHSANTRIIGLISRLEPALVVLLSLIVGVILFSVMLPLLGIMSGL